MMSIPGHDHMFFAGLDDDGPDMDLLLEEIIEAYTANNDYDWELPILNHESLFVACLEEFTKEEMHMMDGDEESYDECSDDVKSLLRSKLDIVFEKELERSM